MPIQKITTAQFRDRLRRAILDRTDTHDVAYGPIRDIVIDPMATVLENQNDRIRTISLLLTLEDPSALSEDDLDGIVFNEGLVRIEGARASTTLTFSAVTVDPTGPNLVVQRGFPVATTPDTSTGETVTFVTTEEATLVAASRSAYFNIQTQRYELRVPARATVQGDVGRVGRGRVKRPLRPLVGFDEVTNESATVGGRDRETNTELVERYLLTVRGTDLATPAGIEAFTRNNFPSVEDVLVEYTDVPRTGSAPGSVDVFIVGETSITTSENLEFIGVGQLIALGNAPVDVVGSVTSGANTYIEGTDYEVVQDTSASSRSVQAVEGVRFLPTATTPLPSAGGVVTVTYSYNSLIRDLQVASEQDENFVIGRDLLFREGFEVDIIIEAQLRVESGFSTTAVPAAVSTAVQDFINGLGLGEPVEASDVNLAARQVQGVDNFIITRLVRDPTDTGTADINIDTNEYARTNASNFTVTLI